MAKVALTEDQLREHLDEQLSFLQSSADAFDAGKRIEAKRMAVVIRTLVRETRNSHALLAQLGILENTKFMDTAGDLFPDNLLPENLLVAMTHDGENDSYLARLDDYYPPDLTYRAFDEWWTRPVVEDSEKRHFTRQLLVLTACDQDGGAHIDPEINEIYAGIKSNSSIGWTFHSASGEETPLLEGHLYAIRQIAHEVLRTRGPDFPKRSGVCGF